jgi:hypothetical protein|tara:strand:+ start:315 stop:482 length:168 start_codon:yes stop_codon:yes gene_type:complete
MNKESKSMEDLQTKLDNLKVQQEQAKELFVKCQGAIELVEAMLEEKAPKDKKDKK